MNFKDILVETGNTSRPTPKKLIMQKLETQVNKNLKTGGKHKNIGRRRVIGLKNLSNYQQLLKKKIIFYQYHLPKLWNLQLY